MREYKRQYRNYTDEDILEQVKNVFSMAQLLRAFNLKVAGGNYIHMQSNLIRLNANCSHWTGKLWSKGKQLKEWQNYSRANTCKKHLAKIKNNTCESCKQDIWMLKPIPLEIHHIDGNRFNNELDNLSLLCCNCHAQTPNWRNKKSDPEKI